MYLFETAVQIMARGRVYAASLNSSDICVAASDLERSETSPFFSYYMSLLTPIGRR